MRSLKKLIYFLLVLTTLVLGILFTVQNNTPVPLNLLLIVLPERALALWLLLAFALGGVLGMLTAMGLVLRLRAALSRANKSLAGSAATPTPADKPAAAGGN